MRGEYCDTLNPGSGGTPGPWRSNLVVDRGYVLLAGLMRSEPGVAGVRYFAVGRGPASPPAPGDRGLADEIYRQPIAPPDVSFVDPLGGVSMAPTSTLAVRVTLRGADLGATEAAPVVLEEFGLFGGDATDEPRSGFLFNRVVHEPLAIGPGDVLERRIELDFSESAADPLRRPAPTDAWVRPGSWGPFGALFPVSAIDGVGPTSRTAYVRAGLATVDDLAREDPARPRSPLDPWVHREMVTKARLVRRTTFPTVARSLTGRTLSDLLTAEPDRVIEWSAGALDLAAVRSLQHALGVLEVALDQAAFERTLLDDLVAPPAMWAVPDRYGPFAADRPVGIVQGVGDAMQERLAAVRIATVDHLARRPPRALLDIPPHHLREAVTKARILRRIQIPGSLSALGGLPLPRLLQLDIEELRASATGLTLGELMALQEAIRVLELAMDQSSFDETRLHELIGETDR